MFPKLFLPRIHAFEFNDLDGLPRIWREGITDAIAFIARIFNSYRAAVPILADALGRTRDDRIIDLCSGSGGTIEAIADAVAHRVDTPITVSVTDKFPNSAAFSRLGAHADGRVVPVDEPVDALAVPAHIDGFRTMFTAFHHFPPEQARGILADAVRQNRGIGIFEYTDRNLLKWLFPTLMTPLTIWLITPFLRPFSFSRLLWTYLLPVIPLLATWDCLVSGLRTYLPHELLAMTASLSTHEWRAERLENGALTALVGVPQNRPDQEPQS